LALQLLEPIIFVDCHLQKKRIKLNGSNRQLKILHIIDSGGLYGAEIMLVNLATEQLRLGMEPIIASIGELTCGEKELEKEARRRGLNVKIFRMRPGPNFKGAYKIVRFARSEGIDVLHSHGYKGNILFGLMPKRIRRIPMIATLHGWTWTGGWDKLKFYEWLDRLSLRFIDTVVVVAETMKNRIGEKKSHVVNNGIPCWENGSSTHLSTTQTSIDSIVANFCREGFVIGAIGRLSSEKGYNILLEAVSELVKTKPEIRLVILGEGEQRSVLEEQISKLGIADRVLLPGYIANAGGYISLFQVFVLSSLTEGLPIVVLEAMQAKVPIVATRVGGVPEILDNGKAGILVAPNNCDSLVQGLSQAIDNQEMVNQQIKAAMQRVYDCYSSQYMAKKYLELYQNLIS
jgi:glycosyltransferase involved in cell wall biosynthesis